MARFLLVIIMRWRQPPLPRGLANKMLKFTTYMFALFISFAAFGRAHEAGAPPLGTCSLLVCDNDYNFTTTPSVTDTNHITFDSMFTIDQDVVGSWMFVDSYIVFDSFGQAGVTAIQATPNPVTLAGEVFGHFLGGENDVFMLNIGTGFATPAEFAEVISYDVEFVGTYDFIQSGRYNTAVKVYEPATLALFAIGLAGLGFMTRRRRVV